MHSQTASADDDVRRDPASGDSMLALRDLTVEFPRRDGVAGGLRAVDGISLELRRGETLALVGESGSGKSMTALSILGLVPEPGRVSAGEVQFDGLDLLQQSNRRLRQVRGNRIAMIFQEPMTSLNPVLSIGRQVAESIRVHRRVSWEAALERAAELLEQVAIPDARARLDAFPHEFSGGMRQRVMIAMALACDPELIIADEPTTALDVTVQAQILELLKDLTRARDVALILITHDLGVVARYADRVAVMYAGRIVEQGPARPVYAQPCHPYTRGLMASVPRLDDDPSRRLVPIAGQPPDLAALPPGCRFAPRCPHARQQCEQRPDLRPFGALGQERACWGFPGEPQSEPPAESTPESSADGASGEST